MKLLARFRSFASALVHRSRLGGEIDEELRAHIQDRASDLERSGLSRVEAERRARLEFGGYQKFKEECREARGTRFVESLLQDTRYAFRMLRKSPGFTAVAVLTLALGIGANTAVFSVIDAALLRPLPYREPTRLVQLNEGAGPLSVPAGDFLDWQRQTRSYREVAAIGDPKQMILTGSKWPDQVWTAHVSTNLFQTLGVDAEIGRTFIPGETQAVVLGHGLWRQQFSGSPTVIGRPIYLDGKLFTIVGVMPSEFYVSGTAADVWLPLNLTAADAGNHTEPSLSVIARLKPRVDRTRAEAEMEVVEKRLAAQKGKAGEQEKISLTSLDLPQGGEFRRAMLSVFSAVLFTLLIACANVASMFFARGTLRFREMAVRSALGASRGRLMRQLLTESMVVSAIGAAAGLGLGMAALRVMFRVFPDSPYAAGGLGEASINIPVLGFALGLCLICGAFVGVMPAWKAGHIDVSGPLNGNMRGAIYTNRLRTHGALVVLETALSLMLLIGAGLMVQTFHRLMTIHTGFNPNHVLTARIPLVNFKYQPGASTVAFYEGVLGKVTAIPGVASAAITNNFPLSDADVTLTIYGGADASGLGNREVRVQLKDVTAGYFSTMGIPLLKGRAFSNADGGGSPAVAIVSESLARRYWPNRDPIGKPLYGKVTVVGIVGDTIQDSLRSAPQPTVYRPYDQQPLVSNMATLVVRSIDDPSRLAPSLRDAVWEIEPDQPVIEMRTMRGVIADSVWQPRFSASMFATLALVALCLALVGIYGVVSYSAAQRTHEIGIRVALGAQPADIVRIILGEGFVLAFTGIAIGVGGALALTRFLRSLLFEVEPSDPTTFVSVALVVALVALLACYIPARRAMRVDPMVALRHE